MADNSFFENNKGKIGIGAISTILAGIVCIQVFMIDKHGKTSEGAGIASVSEKNTMDAQGAHSILSDEENDQGNGGGGHEFVNSLKSYANSMSEGDALAITMTIMVSIAILALVIKLLRPSAFTFSSATEAGVSNTNSKAPDANNNNLSNSNDPKIGHA